MSEFELRLLQQGTADKTPVLPIFSLCFQESELVLLTAAVASKGCERS
jgi:hypothetical protein